MARAVTRRTDPQQRAPTTARASAAPPPRIRGIDALRGSALLLMFVYHFAFDLRYYGRLHADFEHDPFWLGFRALIVSSFMLLVGVSVVLVDRRPEGAGAYLRRIGWIALAALAVTVASYVMFPATFIYFGILHCIAVASLLAWPLRRAPRAALALGAVIVIAGLTWSSPWFDVPYRSWVGFMTHKPATEDYVPLAPWAGAAFIGIAVGRALVRTSFRAVAPLARAPRWLCWMGRHSLIIYLVHQPILLGMLWAVLAPH